MRIYLAPLLALALSLISPSAHAAACGFAKVQLEGATGPEEEATCRALSKTLTYFKAIGINVDPEFRLVLEDEVLLPEVPGQDRISVHGYFDTDTKEIHLVSFRAPRQKDRLAFGLAWTDSMAESILLHEIVHMLAISYMGDKFKTVAPAWHEAIAYTIQIELMPAELKEEIRQSRPADRFDPYNEKSAISSMSHGMNPDGFALHSHASLMKWGGAAFIKSLLDGKEPAAAPRDEQF